MKLVTKQIEKTLVKYPLYSQESKGEETEVIVKFFSPVSRYTWYVTEAEKRGNDWLFFGLVVNNYGEKEYGYFTLSQLEEIRLPFGLRIERDMYFDITPIKNIA